MEEHIDEYSGLFSKYYRILMSDGSVWAIPLGEIAINRAEHYAGKFNGDMVESLYKDTLPLFAADMSEVTEWAKGNMDWSDVRSVATQIKSPTSSESYAEDWINPKGIDIK